MSNSLWPHGDHNLPGSSVHGVFQAIILERATISHSGGSSRPKDWTCIYCVSCLGRLIIYPAPGKSSIYHIVNVIVYLVITFCKWVQLYLTCHGMWQWILNGKVNKYYILWFLGTQDICLSRPACIFSSTRRCLPLHLLFPRVCRQVGRQMCSEIISPRPSENEHHVLGHEQEPGIQLALY